MLIDNYGDSLSAALLPNNAYSGTGLGTVRYPADSERLTVWVKLVVAAGSPLGTVTIRITGSGIVTSSAAQFVPLQSTLNSTGLTALEHAITVAANNTYYHCLQTSNHTGAMMGVRVEAKGDVAGGASDNITASLVSWSPGNTR